MSETRKDDLPRPKSRSVRGIATSNKAAPGCGGPLVAAAAIIHALCQRKKNNQDKLVVNPNVKKNLGINQSGVERFSLKDLQVATDNFSPKNIIGGGGFGNVYKGQLSDGSFIALKRLKEEKTQDGELQFQAEVEMISMAIHRNLLRLRGFCMTPKERILVYPFMPNGSVASCLRERSESQPPLSWEIRKRIALGAARGLAYLHEDCDPKIIHRNVKSANILLDEEFEAVIGEFGLVKLMNYKDTHVTTAVRGTIGHIAPEYLSTGKSSEKTDIYGYGVMLLELVSGQKVFDLARQANDDDTMLPDWVKELLRENKFDTLVDADLHGNFYVDEVEDLLHIALLCTQISPMERPKMSEIVKRLSHLLDKRSDHLKMPTRSPQVSLPLPSSSSPASACTHIQSQQTKAQNQASKVSARKDKQTWLGNLKCFSLKDIAKATDDFDPTFIIGKGAFGNVYKGKLPDGHVVAIKRQALKEHNQEGELQFQAEIEMIGKAIHRNLLRLLGYCVTPTERILVYPFMVNGSVASWLKGRDGVQSLPWEIRKKIAVGAAKGFVYLHKDCDPKIIHRDVKAENILLDEDFEAKVADFGLVKFLESEDTHVTTDVRGTPGYIAPEYFSTRRSSARTDVFGYGRTLMEIISGKRPFELAKAANDSDFTDWVCKMLEEKKWDIIVDASLQGNYVEDEVKRFIQVALLCTQHSAKKRPEMSEVITMLESNDGNRLDKRWVEWQQLLEHDKADQSYTNFDLSKTFESLFNQNSEEISAPR